MTVMNPELELQGLTTSGAKVAPAPTGIPATDFANLRDFFAASLPNDYLAFPPASVYPIYSGAIQGKPGQIIDGCGATLQRAPELVATTTTPVGNGSTSVTLSSVAGLQVGMSFNVKGAGASTGDALIAFAGVNSDTPARIASIDTVNNIVNFEAAIVLTLDITTGNNTSEMILAGATFAIKNALIDVSSLVAGAPVQIKDLNIDGNWSHNQTNNHWTSTVEILSYATDPIYENISVLNAPGEAFMQHGDNAKLYKFTSRNSRGNAIHLNGYNYNTHMVGIFIDGANLDYNVGHSNGGVIASNNTYRAILDGFSIRNCRLFGVGSWDSSDNAFAKICNGYIRDCWGGGLQLVGAGAQGAPQACDVHDIEVWNCGPSVFGMTASSSTVVERARNFNVKDIKFYNSLVYIGGLSDSAFDIMVDHDDSGTLTALSVLSGRKDGSGTAMNFGGRIDGTSFNGPAALNLTPDVFAVVTALCLDNCDIKVNVRDGTMVTPPTKVGGNSQSFTFQHPYSGGLGGPTLDTRFDIKSIGGNSGPHLEGVFRGCRADIVQDGVWGGAPSAPGEGFYWYSRTNSACAQFPAATYNGIIGVTPGGTPNPNGKGYGSGGTTIRTEYALVFSTTNQIVAPSGWFVVEDGAMVDYRITRPGSYSSGAATISLANAPGLSGVTLTPVMGETPPLNVSDSNEVNLFVHTAKNPSGAYMAKVRQDTASSAGCGRLAVTALLRADDAGGGVGFSDTSHESVNLVLKDVRVEGPASGWTPLQLTALSGSNIGSSRVGKLTGPAAYATPVGWGSDYAQRGATTAGFAATGYVGEVLTATLAAGAAVALTAAASKDVLTLALTKGNWTVTSVVDFALSGATASSFKSGLSVTQDTLPTQAGGSGIGTDALASLPLTTTTATDTLTQLSQTTVSVAADTTVHLVGLAAFSAGTVSAYGTIRAQRIA